jgi:peptidoglycan/LPS O-acetylase OafA/YrhL
MVEPRRRILQLDGLRGILALQVAFFHINASIEPSANLTERVLPILMNNWIAVDIFFAMSGFVMCYVYGARFRSAVRWDNYALFIRARFARIVPVNTVTMLLFSILLLPAVWGTERFLSADGRYSWQSLVAGLLLLQGPAIDHRTWNYPSWSVSVEWCLYFAFPVLALYIRGRLIGWVILIATLLGAFALYNTGGYVTNGPSALLRGGLLFVSGIGIFQVHDSVNLSGSVTSLSILIVTAVVLWLPVTQPFAVFLVPAIIVAALQSPAWGRVLASPVFVFLGVVSYSLYMVHALVQIVIVNRLRDFAFVHIGASPALGFVLVAFGLALALVCARLMVSFVERPARNYLRAEPSATVEGAPANMSGRTP